MTKSEVDTLLAVRTWTVLVRDKFEEFKPNIEGAIEALNEWIIAFDSCETGEVTRGGVWSDLLAKIDELTEEGTENKGK